MEIYLNQKQKSVMKFITCGGEGRTVMGGSYFIGEMMYYLNTDFGKLNVYMIGLKVINKIL